MNGATTPSAQSRGGAGCCGLGCASIFGLIILFAAAFIGGGLWAVRHYTNKYTSTAPITLPVDPALEEEPVLESSPPPAPGALPVPTPAATPTTRSTVREIEDRWKTFEKAADREQKARIELSAGEINALLQKSKNTRGKVSVSIDNDIARVRFSVPIKDVPMMKGRYLNGEASVVASPDGDPSKAQITNVVLANQGVSNGMVDQRVFGWPSVRETALRWLSEQNIQTFQIQNNRVIGETRDSR